MKYRMIAVDLDGTVLYDDKTFPDENRDALAKAAEAGARIVVSTGRAPVSARIYRNMLPAGAPVITFQGALALSSMDGQPLFETDMTPESVTETLDIAEKIGAENILVWTRNVLYSSNRGRYVTKYEAHSNITGLPMPSLKELEKLPVIKVMMLDSAENSDRYMNQIPPLISTDMTFCRTSPYYIEFFHASCSKRTALERVAAVEGISREEIMAFGDSYNDIDMLRYAGLGFVMDNAPPDVKELLKTCVPAPSNEENGVAKMIEKYFF